MPDSSDRHSRPVVVVLLVAAVLFIASLVGSPVPTTNEPHYLSKARATANPEWCENDFFLQSTNAHAVFFQVVGPFADRFSFQTVLIVGRVLSLLLLAIGFRSLCSAIGCDGRRTILAASLFFLIGLTGNFSGEWVIGGFESKVPAYGFSLLSLGWLIQARHRPGTWHYVVAGLWSGLSIAWHPVVGMWTLICAAMTETWLLVLPGQSAIEGVRGLGSFLRRGVAYAVSAVVCSLPGLIPALNMLSTETEEKIKLGAKQIQVFYRLAHHLDPTKFPAYSWWHTLALISLVTVLGVVANRRLEESNNSGKDQSGIGFGWFMRFLVCTGIVAAAGVVVGWHGEDLANSEDRHWKAALLQFYPFRLFDAFLPLSTAVLLAGIPFFRWRVSSEKKDRQSGLMNWLRIPFRSLASTAVVVLSITVVAAASNRPASPSGYNRAQFEEWKIACQWLQENTLPDALILGPRESFGMKLYAERAEFVCYKDCPQDAEGIVQWNRRLWLLQRWSVRAFQDQKFGQNDLAALHRQTGIDYIITRYLGPFEGEPVWEGKIWRIYKVVE